MKRLQSPLLLVALAALACNAPPPGVETAGGETVAPPSATVALPAAPERSAGAPLCPDLQAPLVTDLDVRQTTDLSEPVARWSTIAT